MNTLGIYNGQFLPFNEKLRHCHLIGATGTGKTVLLEHLALQDIENGDGICFIDPHGDSARKLADSIPAHRLRDVIFLDAADTEYSVGFNVCADVPFDYRHLYASHATGIFKSIWQLDQAKTPRAVNIIYNSLRLLLDSPGATLLGMDKLITDGGYRAKLIRQCKDPKIVSFWRRFETWSERYRGDAIEPVLNKVDQLAGNPFVRRLIGQESTINIREIMDTRKILIISLSKGQIGDESAALIGGIAVTTIYQKALSRADIPEELRVPFYVYTDEVQNFTSQSFNDILSEARKYRLGLVTANQFLAQLGDDNKIRQSIMANVGTLISFRVGEDDAPLLARQFSTHTAHKIAPERLVGLDRFTAFARILIDGSASPTYRGRRAFHK
jgi:DNA helicase HerA-like ATPase